MEISKNRAGQKSLLFERYIMRKTLDYQPGENPKVRALADAQTRTAIIEATTALLGLRETNFVQSLFTKYLNNAEIKDFNQVRARLLEVAEASLRFTPQIIEECISGQVSSHRDKQPGRPTPSLGLDYHDRNDN
jgi:hypothetical protein